MSGANIKLQQTKVYAGPLRFGVRHEVTAANPPLLTNAFVVDLSYAPYDKERLVRVATLNDLVSGTIPVRTLNTFADDTTGVDCIAGDTLRILNAPPEWGDAEQSFVVKLNDEGAAKIDGAFWWSVAQPYGGAEGLHWELWRSGVAVASGTHGYTRRDGGDGLCLANRFMAVFTEGETALNHMQMVQTYVNSLASTAGLDGQQFIEFPPGNPVVLEFPEQ